MFAFLILVIGVVAVYSFARREPLTVFEMPSASATRKRPDASEGPKASSSTHRPNQTRQRSPLVIVSRWW